MTLQVVRIELPSALLQRAHVSALDEARELMALCARDTNTFLLENYVQELERVQRYQVYEAYYANRLPEDEAEELELLAEFAFADA